MQPSPSAATPLPQSDTHPDDSGYSVQDLFPLVGQTKPAASSQGMGPFALAV
ncbi:hypothetical protein COOONC_09184 [Cooperia oncophora]